MSCIGEEVAQAEDRPAVPDAPGRDETAQEFFARISNPPTPYFDKLARFADDWRKAEADERAEYERRMQDRQDEMLAEMRGGDA